MITSAQTSDRPLSSEYAPYFGKYISLVPEGAIVSILQSQIEATQTELRALSEESGNFAYAPGKWTLNEVVGHLSDSERIFSYRLLRISRSDATPIEGFEQDDYVRYGPFRKSKLSALVDEFACVRQSTLHLLQNLEGDAWLRQGTANNDQVSVRALAYIIAGHELHHMKIVREQYLP